MASDRPAWWRGARGEWWVAAQVMLFALVIFGPKNPPGLGPWAQPWAAIARVVGASLMVAGVGLAIAGMLRLGADLTPLPYPKDCAELARTGPYSLVRHPIYSGLILAAIGLGLWTQGVLTLGYAALLFIFFDAKSRREERWLVERYPDYPAYQRSVRKLVPWIY